MVSAFGHVSLKPALLLSDAAYDLGFGLFSLGHQASELLSPVCFLAMLRTIQGVAALLSAFGHVRLKPALLPSDAAYDLGFGRVGFSFRPCELEARFAS